LKLAFNDSTANHPEGHRWHVEMYNRVSAAMRCVGLKE
jgi:hypothetical protein